ncbi:MAG: CPBP family intramembrane metalloprotease [Ruminiclostridium sp.]|nr:CPBP family intramembrane metalloprotease [Ruminiclostridium sp.]
MNNKKLTLKRLIIFLVISFVPFCIIVPVMWSVYGEPIYASDNEALAVPTYLLGVFGMMIPSIANIITRLVTKEGFRNSYLGMNTKGKMGFWTASVTVPLGYSALSAFLIYLFFLNGMTLSETFGSVNLQSAGMFLMQLAFSLTVFFPAFGEEWGWRGYMMPKLMELMPKPAAVVTGGIIWGLWHAPLTVAGHNFGVDYPGYPFVGIVRMCLMCTLMNAFLTLLTEKTRSIYPAAFCHAVNNNLGMEVLYMIFGSETAVERLDTLSPIQTFIPLLSVLAAVGCISMILLMKKDKPRSDKAA